MRKFSFQNSLGFSLIEIIVTLTILSVVVMGLVAVYPFGLSIAGSAESETIASFLGQRKLEQLRAKDYQEIETGVIEEKHRLSTDDSDYKHDYKRRTEVDNVNSDLEKTDSDTGLKRITTTVYYINDISKTEEEYQIATLMSE